LFEVGRGYTPPTTKVVVKPIPDDISERQFRLDFGLELEIRIFRKSAEGERQSVKDLLGQYSCVRPDGPALLTCFEESGTQQSNLHEIVEMTSCRDASCRLSVKLSNLRACGARLPSLCKWRTVARLKIVVAVLRPSVPREVSLPKSEVVRDE